MTAIALAVAMLVGCGNYTEEVRRLCDTPVRAGPGAGPVEILVSYKSAYEQVKSKKGKELIDLIPGVDYPEKARLLRAAATGQGLTSCPLADYWLEHSSKPSH